MGFIQRRLLQGVLSVAKHPVVTLLIVAGVLAASITLACAKLTISSNQNKLFSSNVPFFHNYLEFTRKFQENEAIYITIDPRKPAQSIPNARWTAVADKITQRLQQQSMKKFVVSVDDRVPLDKLGKQGLLFEDPEKVPAEFAETNRGIVPLAQIWGQKPNALQRVLGGTPIEQFLGKIKLDPHPDQQTMEFVGQLADSWTRTIKNPGLPMRVGEAVPDLPTEAASDPSRLGYYYVANDLSPLDPSKYRLLVRVYPQRNFNSLTAVTETVNAIRNAVNEASKPFDEFEVGVTGRPALEADEMDISNRDSHRAEIVALIVVFIGLVVMFKSLWMALAAEIALGVGIGWTFGWATISEGELNLLSLVFMIALIGIGMDYLVQIMMRYRLEARRFTRADAIWVRVFKHVGPPINTACLGAAGAFLVSVLTDFRGAAELGVIAGGGLILCLVAGYTVLPAILTLWPPKLKPLAADKRYAAHPRLAKASRLLLPLAWGIALVGCCPFIQNAHFNPGLIELQAQGVPSVKLIRTLQTWSAVVLSKDRDQLRRIQAAVVGLPAVSHTESILSAEDNLAWLHQHESEMPEIQWAAPAAVDPAALVGIGKTARAIAEKWAKAAGPAKSLADFADAVDTLSGPPAIAASQRLSQWQNVFVDELKAMLAPFRPEKNLMIDQVPIELRGHLVSGDAQPDYALYIYPVQDLWQRPNLAKFVNEVDTAVVGVPGAPPVTGIASDVYHTTGAIHKAFYQATGYALALIFILVFLDFRRLGPTLGAISVLALGLPMLVSIMGYFGMNWNFANFFGLPILIGAGHEYGVFMVHRYLEAREHPERVWRRWDASDKALLLCAFVTFSSFGFFWLLGHHEGLKSLGLVMALGTACIYLATISVLRPILKYLLEKADTKKTGAEL